MNYTVTILTLLGPLLAGYFCVRAGWLKREWSKPIQRATTVILGPPVIFLSMWSLKVYGVDILGVPLAGAVVCVAGLAVAYPMARLLRLSRQGTGSFIAAGGWSNTFLLGGYLAFMLYGNQGFALMSLYNIPNMPLFYLVGFAVAGAFSPNRQAVSLKAILRDFVTDPVCMLPNVGLLLGLAVNLTGVQPGPWINTVNTYMLPSFTVLAMFAVGMTMTFSRMGRHWRPLLGQSLIKYALWPAITFGVILLVGGNLRSDPVTFRVLMLMSAMPVAMQAMLLSNLFDLDMELVNSLWLVTTLFSLITAPLLVYLLRLP